MIKVVRMFLDGMWARVQLDVAWSNSCLGLRQGCALSPLLYNIVFAVITVVLQRFMANSPIVSDFVYLNDTQRDENDRPRVEGTLEMARRAVWR